MVSAVDLIDETNLARIREESKGAAKTWVPTKPRNTFRIPVGDKHDYAANRLAEQSAVVSHETPSTLHKPICHWRYGLPNTKAKLLAKRNALTSAADRLSLPSPTRRRRQPSWPTPPARYNPRRKNVAERRAEFERCAAGSLLEWKVTGSRRKRSNIEEERRSSRRRRTSLRRQFWGAQFRTRPSPRAGELLKQIDEAIAKAPKAYDGSWIRGFDVPGDRNSKVRNNAIVCLCVQEADHRNGGTDFRPEPKRAAHETPMQKIEGGKASRQTIRANDREGDLTAALELSKVAGT